MTSQFVLKGRCEVCDKFLQLHNRIMACETCDNIVHSGCAKSYFEFNHSKNCWQCPDCLTKDDVRYDPFSYLTFSKHDPVQIEGTDDVAEISKILNDCRHYNQAEFKSLLQSNNNTGKKLTALFNNIDGNATNFDNFTAEISRYHHKFSLIGIAETNIDQCHGDLYKLSGYNSEYSIKAANKSKGSGLAIYIDDSFNYERAEGFSNCTPNLETLFIATTNTVEPITIGAVYRPPSGNCDDAITELENLFCKLPKKNVIIMWDFNIDLLTTSRQKDMLESILYSSNLIPTISLATHEKPGCKPSLIDNILINSTENLLSAGLFEEAVSHHKPIFCLLEYDKPQVDEEVSGGPKYDYCDDNIASFLKDMDTLSNMNLEYTKEGFNFLVGYVKDKINDNFLMDDSTSTKSKRNALSNPWITPGIIASINKKHNLYYKQWNRSRTSKNRAGNHDLYMKYKDFRSRLKNVINHAKKLFYCKKFEKIKGNMKKTWQLINELRGKTKSKMKSSFIIDGKLVMDKREISNGFNIFYSSIARKMNAKLNSSRMVPDSRYCMNGNETKNFKAYLNDSVTGSIFLADCFSLEVEDIIKEFGSDKASDISVSILKLCATKLSSHLANFFNTFMSLGIFPDILKVGKITPVFKKGNSQLLTNYRPISMLPIFGKIFEKVIYKRIYSFLTTNNVIYDKQFGFRKQHSTSHAVNYSVNKILSELEKHNHVIGIFVDLSKAFDTIDHGKLLSKLEHYGIRGPCYELLKSYLTNRPQYTNFQQTLSDPTFIEYGVPQGSVLGPLLFLIFINDIVNSSELGHFVLFADDTNIFVTGDNEKHVYENANMVANNLYEYFLANELHINTGKSVHMYFRPHLSNEQRQTCARVRGHYYSVKVNGKKLKQVDAVKFLGVIIDDKLSWEPQVEYIKQKLNASIMIIKRIRKFIPAKESMKLYDALFKSHLSYCISCWGGISQYKLSTLFSMQKRCVRLLFGNIPTFDHASYYETCARARSYDENMGERDYSLEHTKPLFNKHKILILHHLYVQHTFIELFKIMKFKVPISLFNAFPCQPGGRMKNTSLRLELPKVGLDLSKNNFIFKSVTLWNSLIGTLLSKCSPNELGIMVPGSTPNSDLWTTISHVKGMLKDKLLSTQAMVDDNLPNSDMTWIPVNFYH